MAYGLTQEEKNAIFHCARGAVVLGAAYEGIRASAIEAHRAALRWGGEAYRRTKEYEFMRELDNPCPDLILRNLARKRLLAEAQ